MIFRELLKQDELLDYFRLRHEVYCQEGYLSPHPLAIDLDPFDRHSRFVGAFTLEGGREKLTAGARMILSDETPHAEILDALTFQGLLPQVPPRAKFYNMEKAFNLDPLVELCRKHDRPRPLVEFGRTVVAPALRSTGLGVKLVYALYGLALHHGVEFGCAAVPPALRVFYEKSACRILELRDASQIVGIETELLALVVDLSTLDGPLLRAYQAQRHFQRYGSWTLCEARDCLESHLHIPERSLRNGAAEVTPARPNPASTSGHGWEPALSRLPLLRGSIQLHEATLGAGLQAASMRNPASASKAELLEILPTLGIHSASLGRPGAGGWMRQHALELARVRTPLRLTCWAEMNDDEVASIAAIAQSSGRAIEAELALGCSPLLQACPGSDLGSLLQQANRAVRSACREELKTTFVAEDAGRTPPQLLEPLLHTVVQAGAGTICLADSSGHLEPQGAARLVSFVREFLRRHDYHARLSWSAANDRGMALANALAALEAGADQIQATLLGRGERAGGIAMERLLLHLERLSGRPCERAGLARYLNWGRRELALTVPADLEVYTQVPEVLHESVL